MQMITLIIALVFFTLYFSTQNTVGVTLRFADKTLAIFPLYIIVILTLLLGFLLSYIFSLNYRISSENEKKKGKLHVEDEEKIIHNLQKRISELEESQAQLKMQLSIYDKNIASITIPKIILTQNEDPKKDLSR